MWRAWQNTFSNVVDRHAPIRIKRVRTSKSPWITPQLKQSMHDRDVLKIKAIRSNDLSDWRVFRNCRNTVNNDVKLAKEMYSKNAFHENEGNSRKTWGIINELTSRKSNNSHITEIKQNGISISNSQELSETFNDHYATIGPKLAKEIQLNVNDRSHLDYLKGLPSDHQPFQLIPKISSKILSLLSRLSKSKATGLDKISACFVVCRL